MNESFDFVIPEVAPFDVTASFPAVRPGAIDMKTLNHKRLAATRGMLGDLGYGACLLFEIGRAHV